MWNREARRNVGQVDRTKSINEAHHSAFLGSNATLFNHNSNVMQKGVLIGILILKPNRE